LSGEELAREKVVGGERSPERSSPERSLAGEEVVVEDLVREELGP
jgi:hypothetical protein